MSNDGYALITGASSGIGECFARALAARRRNLILAARSKAKLEALAEELSKAHGVRAEAVATDLSQPGGGAKLADELGRRALEVSLLVNNAGFGARGEFWTLSLDRQTEMLMVNVHALVGLTHRLLPRMIEKRAGAVINVSSTASFQPVAYTTLYAATKALVTSFSMGLAEELRRYNIKVITLCPGGTRTNFFQASQYGSRNINIPGGMQDPRKVVAAGLRALDGKGGLVVSGLISKVWVASQRLMPRGVVTRMAARVFRV